MTTMVYKYGIRTRVDGNTWRPVDELVEQMRMAHDMRNALVEIEHRHEQAMRDLWSQWPDVARIEADLAAAEQAAEELAQRARAEHSQDRTTATRTATATELREARKKIRQLRAERRTAIAEAHPQAKPGIENLQAERKAAIKHCRQEFSARGLYWATYNAIIADHNTAVKVISQKRARGEAAQLRFHRWTGTGTITVQLQRSHGPGCRCLTCVTKLLSKWRITATGGRTLLHTGDGDIPVTNPAAARDVAATIAEVPAAALDAVPVDDHWRMQVTDPARLDGPGPADPPRTPPLLASGDGKWRHVLRLEPWMPPEQYDALPRAERKRIGRGWAHINVGGGNLITVPVQVHRMMPADADVCEAQLVVTRVASQTMAHLCVTVKTGDPQPADRTTPIPVAVHTGWRQRADGSIRVGTWASPVPLQLPPATCEIVDGRCAHPKTCPSLTHIVLPHDGGRLGEILVPAQWLDVAGRPSSLRSIRDKELEPVQRKLAEWLDGHPQPETNDRPAITGGDVRRWRSPDRFARLAMQWRQSPPADGEDIAAVLEAWRKHDKHLWDWEAHERETLTLRRDDTWRRVGAWLADRATTLVVDNSNLAELRRRPDVADDDPTLPGLVAQQARARSALSAPGRLRQLLTAAATRRAVTVTEVEAANLTRTHRECGHTADPHPRYAAAATVNCPHCGSPYDQDHNAAMLMLDRERGGADTHKRDRSR